jgi:hypothetical protein
VACTERSTCTAPGAGIRTFAYVVNECHRDAQGLSSFSQKLLVRRGNCDPATVLELPPVGPVSDPLGDALGGTCHNFGAYRAGSGFPLIGRFQRLGVLPDGSGVVVEITNDHTVAPALAPEPPEEGLFFFRSDGSRRLLGPASAVPVFHVEVPEGAHPPFLIVQEDNEFFNFSPDSRRFALTDTGPGPDGEMAPQIFVLELASGGREQITHLPPPPAGHRATCCAFFADNRTIIFRDGSADAWATVKTAGSDPMPLASVVAVEGATVVPQFGIAGGGTNVWPLRLPGEPRLRYAPSDGLVELFLIDRRQRLQLTNLGYPDTGIGGSTLGRNAAFFTASADPFGTNPTGMCQVFSVGRLGGGLRQLTTFPDDGRTKGGCESLPIPQACRVQNLVQEPATGAVLFVSSCDPLARNPDGEQIFGMRPDGTGLRQLTSFRGVEESDGSVNVELPGPVRYAARVR